jgi:hypothetical protein
VIGLVVYRVVAILGGSTGDLVVEALEVGLIVLILHGETVNVYQDLNGVLTRDELNRACVAVKVRRAHLHVFLVAQVRGIQFGVQLLVSLILHVFHLDLTNNQYIQIMA